MKRPAFQFYPADWRKDVELQSCSMAAQGLWINAMCLAHECEPYGHLTINGKAMTPGQLGRQVGLSPKESEALLAELLDAGVARKTDEGVIYSSRMVRDERLRNVRADAGRLGGNPSLVKQKDNQEVNQTSNQPPKQKPTPSSSSSSSPSGNTPQPPKGGCRRFEEFWTAWPKGERKQDKVKCAEKWRRMDLDPAADKILADIEVKRHTEKWREGFIEAPLVYLNGRRWEDGVEAAAGPQETFV